MTRQPLAAALENFPETRLLVRLGVTRQLLAQAGAHAQAGRAGWMDPTAALENFQGAVWAEVWAQRLELRSLLLPLALALPLEIERGEHDRHTS